jgi:hypothetical protein
MQCAQLNENIFKRHFELEKKSIDDTVSFVATEIQKKKDKEQRLKQFVQQADDVELAETSQEVPQTTSNV